MVRVGTSRPPKTNTSSPILVREQPTYLRRDASVQISFGSGKKGSRVLTNGGGRSPVVLRVAAVRSARVLVCAGALGALPTGCDCILSIWSPGRTRFPAADESFEATIRVVERRKSSEWREDKLGERVDVLTSVRFARVHSQGSERAHCAALTAFIHVKVNNEPSSPRDFVARIDAPSPLSLKRRNCRSLND